MRMLIEEYGLFMISGIAFVACMILFSWFSDNFKTVSQSFIRNLTGVSVEDSTYSK